MLNRLKTYLPIIQETLTTKAQELNSYLNSERHERILNHMARVLELDFYSSRSQKMHRWLASADCALRARAKRSLVIQHVIKEVRARHLRDLIERAETLRLIIPKRRLGRRKRSDYDIAA
jgi:hypothetical protein